MVLGECVGLDRLLFVTVGLHAETQLSHTRALARVTAGTSQAELQFSLLLMQSFALSVLSCQPPPFGHHPNAITSILHPAQSVPAGIKSISTQP